MRRQKWLDVCVWRQQAHIDKGIHDLAEGLPTAHLLDHVLRPLHGHVHHHIQRVTYKLGMSRKSLLDAFSALCQQKPKTKNNLMRSTIDDKAGRSFFQQAMPQKSYSAWGVLGDACEFVCKKRNPHTCFSCHIKSQLKSTEGTNFLRSLSHITSHKPTAPRYEWCTTKLHPKHGCSGVARVEEGPGGGLIPLQTRLV